MHKGPRKRYCSCSCYYTSYGTYTSEPFTKLILRVESYGPSHDKRQNTFHLHTPCIFQIGSGTFKLHEMLFNLVCYLSKSNGNYSDHQKYTPNTVLIHVFYFNCAKILLQILPLSTQNLLFKVMRLQWISFSPLFPLTK